MQAPVETFFSVNGQEAGTVYTSNPTVNIVSSGEDNIGIDRYVLYYQATVSIRLLFWESNPEMLAFVSGSGTSPDTKAYSVSLTEPDEYAFNAKVYDAWDNSGNELGSIIVCYDDEAPAFIDESTASSLGLDPVSISSIDRTATVSWVPWDAGCASFDNSIEWFFGGVCNPSQSQGATSISSNSFYSEGIYLGEEYYTSKTFSTYGPVSARITVTDAAGNSFQSDCLSVTLEASTPTCSAACSSYDGSVCDSSPFTDDHGTVVSYSGDNVCGEDCYCVDCDGGYSWDANSLECYLDSPDLAVTDISVVPDPCSVSTSADVEVTVENIGSQPIQSVDDNVFSVTLSYSVGGSEYSLTQSSMGDTIVAGGSRVYYFNDVSGPGFCDFTVLGGFEESKLLSVSVTNTPADFNSANDDATYSLSCEMTCDDCMVADGDAGWCANSDGLCWYDSTQGKCLRDSMVWQGGACVSCVGDNQFSGPYCSVDSHCCGYPDMASYCDLEYLGPTKGVCTGTGSPCSPTWSDPESIDETSGKVCCDAVLHGTGTYYADLLDYVVYG
ncbi:MAG: hypothetical protein U5R06_19160 [candidate division KSB1 bacterium]|nr:hypothetical protein [candidate division KSB1 bacterium]